LIVDIISDRLIHLRKHLSNRLGEDLSIQDVADKCGLNKQMVYRLEHGLKGSTESLVAILTFYRSHGYNLDWIIREHNQNIPLMVPSGKDLVAISQTLADFSELLNERAQLLAVQIRKLGYSSFDPLSESSGDIMLPGTL
jgi:transcriptional regulator with XRE-family HTH domain